MSKQKVLIVGAGGETGKHILNALIADESLVSILLSCGGRSSLSCHISSSSTSSVVDSDGHQDVVCFIRTTSEDKPSTQNIRNRGVKTAVGELTGPKQDLVALLSGFDTVICCLSPVSLREQIPVIDAAIEAGVKRFVPCHWGTPSARGVLALKDVKEEIDDYIFRHRLGFTVIDVGFWYQASIPRVPSGKFDKAIFVPIGEVYAGGSAPNMLIDARDVGAITAEIIKDERTLNKKVIAYAEVLSQNQIHKIIEDKTGESLELRTVRKLPAFTRFRNAELDLEI